MTVENVLPHGLKTSVFGSQWNVEHGDNLALLDPDRIKSDTLANRPAASVAHHFFFATDNQRLYYDTGSAWVDITALALAHASSHASGGSDALTLAQSQITNLTTDLAAKEASANKGAANGYAPLGSDSKVPIGYIPATVLVDTFTAASQAAMLALSVAAKGDVCVRTDINKTFILAADPYSTLGNWQELLTPTDSVSSVAGKTGVVTLVKGDVGLGNVDNTSDAAKPVSTATQTALNGKMGTTGNESIAGVKTFTDSVFVGTAVQRIKGYYGLLDWMGFVAQIGTVAVGSSPMGVAYCPTNDRIYVTNFTAGTVSVIIPSSNAVTATVTVGTGPMGVAYCPTNDRIYVTNFTAGTVSVIIPSSNTVAATVTVGTNPRGIAYCPTNDRIYVANYGAGTVSVIIPSSNTVTATVTVGTNPMGVAYCPTNDRVYVANYGAGTVSVIIPSSNTVTATVTVGTNPYGVAYCPTNDRIYVTNFTAGTVSVIIPSSNAVTATVTVGTNPYGVAYCPTNDRVYAANYGAGTVSVIIPSSNAVTATVTVGTGPRGVAYCPTNDRIYVANYGAGTVSILT